MVPISAHEAQGGGALEQGPRVHHGTDLDHLIDLSTTTEHPIVITDDDGCEVGVVTRATLLKGIQGGKA